MNFVKTSVYKKEYTSKGYTEVESDARDSKQIEKEERLKKLPEFNRDPSFRSLSEQLQENCEIEDPNTKQTDSKASNFGLAVVTEDDYEFYEILNKKRRTEDFQRQKEEAEELNEFIKAKKSFYRCWMNDVRTHNYLHNSPTNDVRNTSSLSGTSIYGINNANLVSKSPNLTPSQRIPSSLIVRKKRNFNIQDSCGNKEFEVGLGNITEVTKEEEQNNIFSSRGKEGNNDDTLQEKIDDTNVSTNVLGALLSPYAEYDTDAG